jgi:parallel beta-helix repeat protein
MPKPILSSLALMLLVALPISAEIRHVPNTYVTIQQAINQCNSGDVVIVEPGVYLENLNFLGKNITVTGTDPENPDIVAATIIDGYRAGSVVTFNHGEGPEALLSGFTITNGYGAISNVIEGANYIFWGAGIFCNNSSPTIKNNVITRNYGPVKMQGDNPETWQLGYGGAICCFQSNALISHNIIKSNRSYAGAGIMTYQGNAVIRQNLIYDNSAVIGGGVALLGGNLINNTIVGNDASVVAEDQPGFAGNLYAASDPEIGQSLVVNNIICSAKSGAGILIEGLLDNSSFVCNNVWANLPGNYIDITSSENEPRYDGAADRTGSNGNISQDPLFVGAENNDYHLQMDSPCIGAGDASYVSGPNETDIDNDPRIYAVNVDIGADEYIGYIRPVADAGPDQNISRPRLVTLDGSGIFFFDANEVKTYQWTQTAGPAVTLNDPNSPNPSFMPEPESEYRFELVVSDGTYDSFPDEVVIVIKNVPPVADAGPDQSMSSLPPIVTLDGSGSYDPYDEPLTYRWRQISGPSVELSDVNAVEPNFVPAEFDIYVFELVVNDGLADSAADTVGIVIGNRAPVADAGKPRYAAEDSVALDGSASFDPDMYGNLTYNWQQISGPSVTILGSDTTTPVIMGFPQRNTIQRCTFELTVSDGDLLSRPDTVDVVIVPYYGTKSLTLVNPPFDPSKPTIVAFGGGDCNIGGSLTMPSTSDWYDTANVLTPPSYEPPYNQYGDVLIVFLSSMAPDYAQPIQTMGYSTGNMPAIDVAIRLNKTYTDARYAVNRVSFFDTACRSYPTYIAEFLNSSVDGEMCWIDNYIATMGTYYLGTLNIRFPAPPATHGTPVSWYISSSDPSTWPNDNLYNDGITAGYYLSVAGPGKNLRLAPDANNYYFRWNSNTNYLELYDESRYPARILEPVTLISPEDGAVVDSNGVILSCETSERAVGYQLLFGADPEHMNYLVSDTPQPPQELITTFPFETVYWTIKARDEYGATIFADPVRIECQNVEAQTIENLRTTKRYHSIQQAIDDAAGGEEIVVSPGTYPHSENIDFKGKSLTVRSIDPNDPAIVAATVITGDSLNAVVTFSGAEDANCILAGFTINGGKNGIYCSQVSPTITNCNISANSASGIYLYCGSNPIITHCRINNNSGSGIEMVPRIDGRLKQYNHPVITHCVIVANGRHGISGDFPTIINCTICDNLESGINNSTSTITNSIIYFNNDGTLAAQLPAELSTVTYSNVQGFEANEGNIDADPFFADPANGDYHLKSQTGRWDPASQMWVQDQVNSPCIDGGDPNSAIGSEPEPNGSVINIGAYGGTDQASKSP